MAQTPIPSNLSMSVPAQIPEIIYSAAGTPLPPSLQIPGLITRVSDATSPTYLGAYVSGGSVMCSVMWNGTNWVTC
jgi:hypothetical protein